MATRKLCFSIRCGHVLTVGPARQATMIIPTPSARFGPTNGTFSDDRLIEDTVRAGPIASFRIFQREQADCADNNPTEANVVLAIGSFERRAKRLASFRIRRRRQHRRLFVRRDVEGGPASAPGRSRMGFSTTSARLFPCFTRFFRIFDCSSCRRYIVITMYRYDEGREFRASLSIDLFDFSPQRAQRSQRPLDSKPINPGCQALDANVDQRTDSDAGQIHVCRQLGLVNAADLFNRLRFEDKPLIQQYVYATTTAQSPPPCNQPASGIRP